MPTDRWSYAYDLREAVGYLVLGSTSARPGPGGSKEHFNYAVDSLAQKVRNKIRQFSKRKDVRQAEKETAKKADRLALVSELQTAMDSFIRRFPETRGQDIVLAYKRARDKETVRQVMET